MPASVQDDWFKFYSLRFRAATRTPGWTWQRRGFYMLVINEIYLSGGEFGPATLKAFARDQEMDPKTAKRNMDWLLKTKKVEIIEGKYYCQRITEQVIRKLSTGGNGSGEEKAPKQGTDGARLGHRQGKVRAQTGQPRGTARAQTGHIRGRSAESFPTQSEENQRDTGEPLARACAREEKRREEESQTRARERAKGRKKNGFVNQPGANGTGTDYSDPVNRQGYAASKIAEAMEADGVAQPWVLILAADDAKDQKHPEAIKQVRRYAQKAKVTWEPAKASGGPDPPEILREFGHEPQPPEPQRAKGAR